MQAAEIRARFLRFFEDSGHLVVPSSPVVPQGDPTLLFTNAGMNQFKDVFTGRAAARRPRACSSQKCIRAGGKHNDLENVGYTARHHTFFEMLGNFSFGDYFKREAIGYAWKFLTGELKLDSSRLTITVYHEDQEARALWREIAGLPDARILGLGAKDNFWAMGDTGPCGPCSEIYYDRGADRACGPRCGIGRCDCDRNMEIWNLVFMQYEQTPTERRSLPKPSVDTGMGLERIASVMQGVDSNYDTDLFSPLIAELEGLSGRRYQAGPEGAPFRVVADHLRALSFALADGAIIGNEGQGYVLRRILRRAARLGRKLGFEEPFIHRLVPRLVTVMGTAFPELQARERAVTEAIREEEAGFNKTIDRGLDRFESEAQRARAAGGVFVGAEAFYLHDTLGFPVDLVEVMAREQGLSVDLAGFESAMREQKERSRAGAGFKAQGAAEGEGLGGFPPTEFLGYESLEARDVPALVLSGRRVLLARTPFYAESGGQCADRGELEFPEDGRRVAVRDVQKQGQHYVHVLDDDPPRLGELRLHARVDLERRLGLARHHTATHILHHALHQLVSRDVVQKGSLVQADRLRFDVTHRGALDPGALREVEALVNEKVRADERLRTTEMPLAQAKAEGVTALFGEKYGELVRVVDIGGWSRELCGGTHLERTGQIGYFRILSEGSVAAGVRRLEAVAGAGAEGEVARIEQALEEIARHLKCEPAQAAERVQRLVAEMKRLRQAPAASAGAAGGAEALLGRAVPIGDARLLVAEVPGTDREALRALAQGLKDRGSLLSLLFAQAPRPASEPIPLVLVVGSDLAARGLKAGALLRDLSRSIDLSGGGKDELAQGALRDARPPEEIVAVAREFLCRALGEG